MYTVSLAHSPSKQLDLLIVRHWNNSDRRGKSRDFCMHDVPIRFGKDNILRWIKEGSDSGIHLYNIRDHIVDDSVGAYLAVLCMVTNPLSNHDRLQGINDSMHSMIWEELHYWYSKMQGPTKNKGIVAFRTLFDQC